MADELKWLVWPDGDAPADGYEIPVAMAFSAEDAAEWGAERYHRDSAGDWNAGTMVFRVLAPDGTETVCDVEIDYSPNFTAWEKSHA